MATTIYAIAALLAAVACMALPIETTGKELPDSIKQTQVAAQNNK